MLNDLHRWRQEATPAEWAELAESAGTTPGYLNLIAYGYRRASPELANKIEEASKKFSKLNPVLKELLVFATLKEKVA